MIDSRPVPPPAAAAAADARRVEPARRGPAERRQARDQRRAKRAGAEPDDPEPAPAVPARKLDVIA